MRATIRGGVLISAMVLAALAAPAGAQALTCGQTVTHNIKLTADLDCSASASDGLVVGRGGITIDLNQHRITGPGNTGHYSGIDNSAGYNNVTLKNGTVSDYYTDALFEYTTGSKILHVRADFTGSPGSYSGISFWYSQNGLIENSTVSNSESYAIYLYENSRVNLSHSKVVNSLPSDTYGVYDYESHSTIDHTTANGGHYGFYIEETDPGYLLLDNTANGNTYEGFYVYENYPSFLYQTKLVGNLANTNGDYGFYATAQATGKKNRAHGNTTGNCFHVPCSS